VLKHQNSSLVEASKRRDSEGTPILDKDEKNFIQDIMHNFDNFEERLRKIEGLIRSSQEGTTTAYKPHDSNLFKNSSDGNSDPSF
jgi:hypothetical protein